MKQLLREARVLFSGWEIVLSLAFWFAVNYGFFSLVSKNNTVSIIVGVIGALFFFFVFTLKSKKLKRYQFHLSELMKYVTNTTFFLSTGENVPYALQYSKTTVSPEIQKDIEQTIQYLKKDATVETEHFEKYNFPSLDQFHQNLEIYYEHGGNPKELFDKIQENMLFELKKRDELYRKRKGFALNVYTLVGFVVLIPLILRFLVSYMWDIFLSFSFAGIAVLLVTYGMTLLNLYFLQKHSTDISVRY